MGVARIAGWCISWNTLWKLMVSGHPCSIGKLHMGNLTMGWLFNHSAVTAMANTDSTLFGKEIPTETPICSEMSNHFSAMGKCMDMCISTKARELGDPGERTDNVHDVDSASPGRGVSAEAFPRFGCPSVRVRARPCTSAFASAPVWVRRHFCNCKDLCIFPKSRQVKSWWLRTALRKMLGTWAWNCVIDVTS